MQLTHLTTHTHGLLVGMSVKNTLSPLCQKVGNNSWFFEYISLCYSIVKNIVGKIHRGVEDEKIGLLKKVDKKTHT